VHDIIIIGGGAAGMTAALYALRANKSVMVLEKNAFGGQIAYSPKVENFPGTDSMSGNDFADRLFNQVISLGAEFDIVTVTGIRDHGAHKTVMTDDGVSYDGRSVIIATGAKHRHLGVPGEQELAGKGICYCAVCDGDFYRGKKVAMVGGGNTALQEAIFLADICEEVTVIQNLDYFTGEERLVRALDSRNNVKSVLGAQVAAIEEKDGELHCVRIRRESPQEDVRIQIDGLFVAIGLEPENECFADIAGLDRYGYIESDERCLTRTTGVFVAGDCRTKGIRQLTTAVSDGTVAAIAACNFLVSE
jgi:thioredoxin reductase (NADPH)